MKSWKAIALAALSGIILPLALPNGLFEWGNPLFGLCALVPLYVALAGTTKSGTAMLSGAVFGGIAHGLSNYWLWFFKDFRFWTLGTTTIAYMVAYALLALYLKVLLSRCARARTILFAAAWAVIEYGKSTGFLGYPWGLLPYSWNAILPFDQLADVTGVYGLGFVLAFANAALAELALAFGHERGMVPVDAPAANRGAVLRAFRGLDRSLFPGLPSGTLPRASYALGNLALSLMLFSFALAYGAAALLSPRPVRGTVSIALVQHDADAWVVEESEALGRAQDLARAAVSSYGSRPDLIAFSESSLAHPYAESRAYYARVPKGDPFVPFVREMGCFLLTGAPVIVDGEREEASNSAILLDPDGELVASYAKMHPVPFAEAIPFWEVPAFRSFIRNVVGLSSGWVMGTERVLFEIPAVRTGGTVRFAAPICFEDAFPALIRDFALDGADFFVNLTNDAWSLTRSAEIQHFVAARYRSIETRRSFVRSTLAGVSGFVDAYGRVSALLPLFEPASVVHDVPVYGDRSTAYLLYGDWFVAVLIFILALSALIIAVNDLAAARFRPGVPRGADHGEG